MNSTPETAPAKTRLRVRLARLAAAAVVLSLAALLALFAAAPGLLESWLEREASRQLGRPVELGGVGLGLFDGTLVLGDLRVGPPGSEAPVDPDEAELAVDRIAVDLSLRALWQGQVRIQSLLFEAPRLLLVQEKDGGLRPLLPDSPGADTEPDAETASAPLVFDQITVREAGFVFVDLSQPELRPFELELAELVVEEVAISEGEVAIAAARLRDPSLRMLRDFDTAALAGGPPAEAPEADAPSEPLSVRIGEFALSEARLSLLGGAKDADVEGVLSLHASDVSLEPGARSAVAAHLVMEEGSATLAGVAGIDPLAFEGTLEWQALSLARLARAAGTGPSLKVSAGTSAGKLVVRLAEGQPLVLSGDATVAGLAAEDDAGNTFGWDALALAIERIALDLRGEGPPELKLRAVELRKPSLGLARAASEPEAAEEPAADAGPPPRIAIAKLEVSDGALELRDATVRPAYRSRLEALTLSGADLRWPERSVGSLRLRGRSTASGAFSVEGDHRDLAIQLKKVGLSPFSAYIADAAGYSVQEGRADLEARVRLREQQTQVDSKLVLHRLAVTAVQPGKFEKLFGIPLDLTLALLRDPFGNITLPIGLTLGAGESRVDMASILIASVRQALLGALSTPLKGAGLLLRPLKRGESLALAPVVFAPGAGRPAADAAQTLAGIEELLASRPGLRLRLHGRVGPADLPAIAERLLTEQVLADAELPPVDAGFLQRRRITGALEERARGETGPLEGEDAAVLAKWLDSVQVDEAQRQGFAHARAESVRDVLVDEHGVAAERLEVGAARDGEPGVVLELAPQGG